MSKTITVTAGGRELTFTLRPNVPLAVHRWMERVKRSYAERDDAIIPNESATTDDYTSYVRRLTVHTVLDEDLCLEGMRVGYIGDHAAVDWYNDTDGNTVRDAIVELVAHFFITVLGSVSQSLTSSSSTAISSEATPQTSAYSSTTN